MEDFLGIFAFEDALAGFRDQLVRLGGRESIPAHKDLFEGFLRHDQSFDNASKTWLKVSIRAS